MKDVRALDQIYDSVKNQIMTKAIFPGSRIVEDDLAKEANVSRAAVRNVMNTLQSEGFVRIVPNKGAFVVKPTYDDVLKIYQTRCSLEVGIAAFAVNNITEDSIARLEENYAAQQALKNNFSIIEYVKLNKAFHWEIVLAARNEYFAKYLNEIYNIVHIYILFYDNEADNTKSLQAHKLILDALKERNQNKLEDAFRMDNYNGIDDLGHTFGINIT